MVLVENLNGNSPSDISTQPHTLSQLSQITLILSSDVIISLSYHYLYPGTPMFEDFTDNSAGSKLDRPNKPVSKQLWELTKTP